MTDALFDGSESERRKEAGKALAAANRGQALERARAMARSIASERLSREVTADDVARALPTVHLGPAAGSLFRGSEWEFTGRRVRSEQVLNHSRELKVWRLCE
jgi:hypothetical protein